MTHSRGGRLMSVGKEKAPGDFSLGACHSLSATGTTGWSRVAPHWFLGCTDTYTASTLYSTFMRTQIQRVRTI